MKNIEILLLSMALIFEMKQLYIYFLFLRCKDELGVFIYISYFIVLVLRLYTVACSAMSRPRASAFWLSSRHQWSSMWYCGLIWKANNFDRHLKLKRKLGL